MNRKLSLSQRIYNASVSQEVENAMGRHVWNHARGASKEDFGSNWSKREDIVWGHGWGRCCSRRTLWFSNVTGYDNMGYHLYVKIHPIYPQIGGVDPRPLFGVACHNTCSDIVEVADDGESARATLVTPGFIFAPLNPDQHNRSLYLWERYGLEIVHEDDEWKFLQIHVCPDIISSTDNTNWAFETYRALAEPEEAKGFTDDAAENHVPYECEDPGPIHNFYSPVQTVQNTCPWPEPYETMEPYNHFRYVKDGVTVTQGTVLKK